MKWFAALFFLGLNFYTYHFLATDEIQPARSSFSHFPMAFGDWRCPGAERMGKDVEDNLGVTDYILCTYSKRDSHAPGLIVVGESGHPAVVGLYVGYHASQVRKAGGGIGTNMIHPPAHCLPGSGWDIIAAQLMPLNIPGLPGAPALVNRLVVAKGDARQLVYYWYQERGHVISRDWMKIVDLFWSRATLHRTDGSLVRFTVPLIRNDETFADQLFQEFAGYVVPQLPQYIPN